MNHEKLLLETIKTKKGAFTPFDKELLKIAGNNHVLGSYLSRLHRNGHLKRLGRGVYQYGGTIITRTTSYELVFGLELELEYNKEVLGFIPTGGYHDNSAPEFGNYWRVESDGSLSTRKFVNGKMAEFISEPLPYDKVLVALAQFQKRFETLSCKNHPDKTFTMTDLINFNSTTGAHVHIGLLRKNHRRTTLNFRDEDLVFDGVFEPVKEVANLTFLRTITKNIKRIIKNELPLFYDHYQRDYYRRYAERITKEDNPRAYKRRHNEFNFTTPYNTVEWRSSHLHGITTWDDLFKYFTIVTTEFQKGFLKEFKKENPFFKERVFNIETETGETVVNIETNIWLT